MSMTFYPGAAKAVDRASEEDVTRWWDEAFHNEQARRIDGVLREEFERGNWGTVEAEMVTPEPMSPSETPPWKRGPGRPRKDGSPPRSRGRVSAAEASVAPRMPGEERPEPPEEFDEREAALWRRIVEWMPVGWFGAECQPVLAALCSEVATREDLAERMRAFRAGLGQVTVRDIAVLSPLHSKLSKSIKDLSVALRLTPSARTRPEVAATAVRKHQAGSTPKMPFEM